MSTNYEELKQVPTKPDGGCEGCLFEQERGCSVGESILVDTCFDNDTIWVLDTGESKR